jgi:peroxiredoxin family protein
VESSVQAGHAIAPEMETMVRKAVDEYMAQKEAEAADKPKKMVLVATKGTLDWAYPPLIMASTAAAMGWEVGIFFTFYGLNIIHKKKYKNLSVAPLGNPAMPMPVPNIVGAIPGMTKVGTSVMKSMFKSHGVASIEDLLEMCMDLGVKFLPCGMTIEVFGYDPGDFIDGIEQVCGAAHFIEYAADADVSIFV